MKKIEFPFYEVLSKWESRDNDDYGTVKIVPAEIKVRLITECPKLDASWYIFATTYQTNCFPKETVDEIYNQIFILHGRYYGIKYMNWIRCIVKQPPCFNIDDKWKIIGWLFSLCFEKVPV